MSSQNILKSFSFSHFHMKSSPGVGGLDADEGAGDHLDVAKQGGHPNNDNLRKLKVENGDISGGVDDDDDSDGGVEEKELG